MNGLFKYFPVDLDKAEMLARQQILLTPPKYFNDPWDFLARRDPVTDDEIRMLFEDFQRKQPGPLTLQEFKASVTRSEFVEQEGPNMQDGLSKIFGVVSLTSDPYNRLMWGYYADSHRGFVAEFAHGPAKESPGVEAVVSPFAARPLASVELNGLAIKVRYASNLPRCRADFSNSLEVYSTKHEEWGHENEWRVIEPLAAAFPEVKDGKTFYLLRFNPKHLVRVILGLRVDLGLGKRLSEMLDTKEFAHVKKERMEIDASSGQLTSSSIR